MTLKPAAPIVIVIALSPVNAPAAGQDNVFGFWGGINLQGDFKAISPKLDGFKWQVLNQTRTRDDSSEGSRFSENLLFSQIGYQYSASQSLWLGYTHDWLDPLRGPSFQENRPYVDWLWRPTWRDFKFTARSRMEARINQRTGDDGYRARQMLQVSHPVPFAPGLNWFLGNEVMFFVNESSWGRQGFTEQRVFSGFNYHLTPHFSIDLGYMGQFVDNKAGGNNLFTHNLQTTFNYHF